MDFRSGLVEVSYPDEIINYPTNAFSVDSSRVSHFDPGKHNSILVSTYCHSNNWLNGISIPQMASYITHFRLQNNAFKVELEVGGVVIKKWNNVVNSMWYNIYDYPLNIYLVPYGQRFLRITCNEGDSEKDNMLQNAEIMYIACDNDTHEKVITASGLRK